MTVSRPPPFIRHATREDIPDLLAVILMLGTYSKDVSSVHPTETSLSEHISFALSTSSSSPKTLKTSHQTNGTTSKQTNIDGSTSKEDSFEPLTPQKTARALLLFDEKESEEPAGYAVYYFTFSTWNGGPGIYLEDLFVRDEFRGKGFGVALLRKLATLVEEQGGKRLQWTCLKWNQPSLDFYQSEKIGAKVDETHCLLKVEGENLKKLAGDGAK